MILDRHVEPLQRALRTLWIEATKNGPTSRARVGEELESYNRCGESMGEC